jgi:hypothetical protein
MPHPSSAALDTVPALELVLEHARTLLAEQQDGPWAKNRLVGQKQATLEPGNGVHTPSFSFSARPPPTSQGALEQLDLSGDANKARLAHADYFVTEAEALAPEIRGPGGTESVAWLQAERSNMMAAFSWLVEAGSFERALRRGSVLLSSG